MGVRVDTTGNVLGHFWSKTMKAGTYKAQTAREMVIGRIKTTVAP